MSCNPPDTSMHGIIQARILEWVAISSSRGSSRLRDQTWASCVSCVGRWILYHWATWGAQKQGESARNVLLFATPSSAACQAPLVRGCSRQECCSDLPFLSPGGLPNPETEPISPALAGRFFTAESIRPWKSLSLKKISIRIYRLWRIIRYNFKKFAI